MYLQRHLQQVAQSVKPMEPRRLSYNQVTHAKDLGLTFKHTNAQIKSLALLLTVRQVNQRCVYGALVGKTDNAHPWLVLQDITAAKKSKVIRALTEQTAL